MLLRLRFRVTLLRLGGGVAVLPLSVVPVLALAGVLPGELCVLAL